MNTTQEGRLFTLIRRFVRWASAWAWSAEEGVAAGDELHTPWMLEDCIQDIAAAIASAKAD